MARHKEFDREEVLERAMRLFWRQGYEASSVQALVEATGVNRASLYNSFGDKQGLFLAVLDHYQTSVGAGRLALLQAPGSPVAALRRFFDDLVAFSVTGGRRLGCLMTNSAVALAPRDRDCEARLRDNLARVEDAFYRLIRRAQAEGEVPAQRDARALARFLAGTVQGLRVIARLDPQEDRLRDVVDTALSAVTGEKPLAN